MNEVMFSHDRIHSNKMLDKLRDWFSFTSSLSFLTCRCILTLKGLQQSLRDDWQVGTGRTRERPGVKHLTFLWDHYRGEKQLLKLGHGKKCLASHPMSAWKSAVPIVRESLCLSIWLPPAPLSLPAILLDKTSFWRQLNMNRPAQNNEHSSNGA